MNKATVTQRSRLDPERWSKLKEILADALEQDSPAARTALVQRRCAEDATLLAEAASLVREAEEFLKEPTDSLEDCAEHATAKLWQDEAPRSGWRIGAYVVVRELGRGGMGAVYLGARADGQFEKEVAIKVLKRGTDTEEVLRRFASERHILARLDHPNIARLLDAGTTEDGLPYFVMEYVGGAPVTRYVRERTLSIEERLGIFLKVCAAVEVAHHNHVIHRDLKPSNILVNAEGEPKLLDFGIAKLLTPGADSVEITAAGEERLTPICASPEQTDGRPVTEASDVYALGALLYEMLSGQKPHKFSCAQPSREEICSVVREQEPPLPSARAQDSDLARRLRGDLDAIVLKALRKEPAQRYHTVTELAADVRRHLARQPVLARDPGVTYRTKVFLSRHRMSRAALATAGLVLIVATILFTLWNRPRQSATTSMPNEHVAVSNLRKSIAVLPFDNFGSENPSYFADGVQDNILTDLGKVGDLMVVSRNAVASYRGKARNARDIGHELGVGNVLVGSVQKSGDRVRINTQLIDTQTETQIWAEHYDRNVEDIFALQSELAQTIVTQLKAKLSSGEQAEIWKRPTEDLQAYDLYLQARATYTSPSPDVRPVWNETVKLTREAIARDPKFTLAYCLLNDVQLMMYRFGADHSPELLASAKEAAETALRLEPNLEDARLAMARYYYNGLNDNRRTEQELSKIPASAAHAVEFYTLSSLVERRLGRWKDSIRDGERAVELDPQAREYTVNLAQTYSGLRKYSDANRVIDAAVARAGDQPTARLALVKSEAAIAVGDLAEARAALDRYPEGDGMDYQSARLWLCLLERDFAGARGLAERATRDAKETPTYWLIVGAVAEAQGKRDEALRDYENVKRWAQHSLEKWPDNADALGELAAAEARLGASEEAIQHARRAVEVCSPSSDALAGPGTLMRLAEVLAVTGDRDRAFEVMSRLVKMPFGLTYGDLKLNPMWDFLRDDPRFARITAEAALPFGD